MFYCVDFGGEFESYELKVEYVGCEDVFFDVLCEFKGFVDRFRIMLYVGVGDSELFVVIDLNVMLVFFIEYWRDGTIRFEKFEYSLCVWLLKFW